MPLHQSFRIEDGVLIRSVTPRRGAPYEHACTERVYKDAAYAVEQFGAGAFTGEEVRAAIDAPSPFTQVAVAMAFLKERGCIVPARGRRHVAATDYTYEDALIEYHALKDGSPGSAAAAGQESGA